MEIRVAHSIFAFTSLDHNYDVSLKGVRVQELTSETVSSCSSTSIFHIISSWHPSSQSPPDGQKTKSLRAVN